MTVSLAYSYWLLRLRPKLHFSVLVEVHSSKTPRNTRRTGKRRSVEGTFFRYAIFTSLSTRIIHSGRIAFNSARRVNSPSRASDVATWACTHQTSLRSLILLPERVARALHRIAPVAEESHDRYQFRGESYDGWNRSNAARRICRLVSTRNPIC